MQKRVLVILNLSVLIATNKSCLKILPRIRVFLTTEYFNSCWRWIGDKILWLGRIQRKLCRLQRIFRRWRDPRYWWYGRCHRRDLKRRKPVQCRHERFLIFFQDLGSNCEPKVQVAGMDHFNWQLNI